jgi:hypothetical protein
VPAVCSANTVFILPHLLTRETSFPGQPFSGRVPFSN